MLPRAVKYSGHISKLPKGLRSTYMKITMATTSQAGTTIGAHKKHIFTSFSNRIFSENIYSQFGLDFSSRKFQKKLMNNVNVDQAKE